MKKWLGFLVIVCILLGGCNDRNHSSEQTAPDEHESPSDDNEQSGEKDKVEEAKTYPLTGLEAEGDVNQRVIAAVINNSPAARPQSGLLEADMVYEVLAEFEVTRFVALYQSQQPERIGPIRSARPYFVDLADGYEALMVIHGWSPAAETVLTTGTTEYLNGISYDGTLFERYAGRKAPHNSYLNWQQFLEGVELEQLSLEAEVEPLTFLEDNETVEGIEAQDITINYLNLYDVHYRYDESQASYTRHNNQQTVDYETGEAIEVSNLFIIEAEHEILDQAGRRAVDLESGGKALLIHRGKMQELEWVNEGGRILPIKNGEIIPFAKGQTWINIIPHSPGISGSVAY
ncbi:DUF3048 domain-containing protein [Alkalihalobacillus pseudalcaliphilus]|uniref:DUF3048 domain-containing protein n=1 Tax=Alkalihalobacillus pseudalcaliphilus TaxID=79884 RepID=UPI00064DF917|nr:DUF3048 domain-containing protein [Alkalihalobacillus pseudalcaliphilus]KMK75306.1 hypothetical protein AB990_18000 [Alkalihalobacillus pseudalcaliphilus]